MFCPNSSKAAGVSRKHGRCRLIWRLDIRRAADDAKSAAVATEELLQILQPAGVALQRSARRDDSELVGVRGEANPIQQNTQQVGDLGPRRAPVRVQLVYYEKKDVIRRLGKPRSRLFEDVRFDATHEHDVQHRVVGDQDVGRRVLHIPPGPHLRSIHLREEAFGVTSGYGLRVLMDTAELIPEPRGVGGVPFPGDRSPPGIATEVDMVSVPVCL